ncbi:phosphonate C-P lyase system protein PhnG [Chachezhania sediminis]|uniref:phosphonate C-P lyase system protein PhnG n=1 Tax=Chachezhania sediminis TaxID=2599291 RepID=UPI00131AB763|nr:phosphonate C-P lyase system protein PhnG [Chachezhania sediminis]
MTPAVPSAEAKRRRWMSLLSRAPEAQVLSLWAGYAPKPDFDWLRRPEAGAVMVRGRMGGNGAPFNLGEMTVTRCSVRTADGRVGHAYVQGRGRDKAEAAALVDALMQGDEAPRIEAEILSKLEAGMEEARARRAGKAAATKVDFFTLVRGEDA